MCRSYGEVSGFIAFNEVLERQSSCWAQFYIKDKGFFDGKACRGKIAG